MDEGGLVSDDIVIGIIDERIKQVRFKFVRVHNLLSRGGYKTSILYSYSVNCFVCDRAIATTDFSSMASRARSPSTMVWLRCSPRMESVSASCYRLQCQTKNSRPGAIPSFVVGGSSTNICSATQIRIIHVYCCTQNMLALDPQAVWA